MKSSLLKPGNIFLGIGAVFQAVLYLLLLRQNFTDPEYLKRMDYVSFYTGGYIARYDSFSQLYDLDLQRQVQEDFTAPTRLIRFYPYNHPPLLARILQLTTTTDYIASYARWIIALAVFHLASLFILALLARSAGWRGGEIWILGISGLIFFPAVYAYLKGQDSTFLLLSVSLWTFGLLTGRERIAGLGLALTAIRPQVTLFLAIPFLFKRRRIWWWFVLFGLVLLIYSFLLIGFEGLKDLVAILFFTGQGAGFDLEDMHTLMGALTRLFPNSNMQYLHLVGYGGYALAIILLCVIWKKSKTIGYTQAGLAVILYMLFSPHMHSHDLILLLIPATNAATLLFRERTAPKVAILLPMGVSLLLLMNQFLASHILTYLIFLSLALALCFPSRFGPPSFGKTERQNEAH